MLRTTACLALFCLALPAWASGRVEIVSVPDPGSPSETAGALGFSAVASADGRYVAFLSAAPNMLAGQVDGNHGLDVFVHDRVLGSTTLISHAAGAPDTAGDGGLDLYQVNRHLALSSDGRWVAFLSSSTDLVPGQVDTAGTHDAFVHDRNTGATTLVSHADGLTTQASGGVTGLVASQDGRWIAFISTGGNHVAGQTDSPGTPDVFLQDRTTGATTLVSHTASALQAAGGCTEVEISADGSRVAFTSSGSGSESAKNVYLFDRGSGAIALVSHTADSAGTPAGGSSPVLSSDGNWVAFVSRGTNLVAGQINGPFSNDDVFLYERASGAILLASHAAGSTVTTDGGSWPSLSADGRFAAFLTPGEKEQVRLYDRTTGAVVLVSHTAASPSTPGNQRSFGPRVSADGNWVAFGSYAADLVTGQTDMFLTPDAFLYNRITGANRLVSHVAGSSTTACLNQAAYKGSSAGAIASDGSFVLLSSYCPTLIAGLTDANTDSDLFVYDRASDANSPLSVRLGPSSGSAPGMNHSDGRSVSHDGRYVAFTSQAANFVPGQVDPEGSWNVYLRDRVAGTTVLVSHAAGMPQKAAAHGSSSPAVSADGSFVAFLSSGDDLVPGQATTSGSHLYLYERATGTVRLVDHVAGSPSTTGEGSVWSFDLSGDGRWLVYWGMNLGTVAGTPENKDLIYLFDRLTGETRVVNASAAGFGSGRRPQISADGRYVLFEGQLPGDPALSGLLLYDREAAAWTRISQWGQSGRISADGRWVAFLSDDTSDVPGLIDANFGRDVFLWDRVSGGVTLASHAAVSPNQTGNAESAGWYNPIASESLRVLSADGRYLLFSSKATDLVPSQSDTFGSPNLFLFDRVTGGVTLVDHTAASPTAASIGSYLASISADGSRVAFIGRADLSWGHIYLFDTATGSLELAAGATGSPGAGIQGASIYLVPSLSADGRVAAFSSTSPELVDGDMDGLETMFAWVGPDRGGDFFTVAPCRLLDTRLSAPIASGATLRLKATGSCGIPATAVALAVNLTVLQPGASGRLSVLPGDVTAETSTLNFQANENRANNATLRLSYDGSGTLRINPVMNAGGTVHVTVDVTGYYE